MSDPIGQMSDDLVGDATNAVELNRVKRTAGEIEYEVPAMEQQSDVRRQQRAGGRAGKGNQTARSE